MEIRIPTKLLTDSLATKQVKALRLFLTAKILYNSRARIRELIEETDTHPRTGARLIKSIIINGWAGTDGTYLFPRAWHRIKAAKRGGLYLFDTSILSCLRQFESLAFAHALKKLYRRKGPRTTNRSAKLKDLSLRYVANALNLKERRCKTLRARAQRYGFIHIKRQYRIIGKVADFRAFRQNIHGPPLFQIGKYPATPEVSRITFHV